MFCTLIFLPSPLLSHRTHRPVPVFTHWPSSGLLLQPLTKTMILKNAPPVSISLYKFQFYLMDSFSGLQVKQHTWDVLCQALFQALYMHEPICVFPIARRGTNRIMCSESSVLHPSTMSLQGIFSWAHFERDVSCHRDQTLPTLNSEMQCPWHLLQTGVQKKMTKGGGESGNRAFVKMVEGTADFEQPALWVS